MKLYLLLLLQDAAAAEESGFTNELVRRFNEGNGDGFMWPILICLVIGLAIAFERIITLNRADINTRKFMNRVKDALETGGVASAEEVCANQRGPVASVVQSGLLRYDEGMDAVEKAVVSYGSIEMSFLERGLVWLSLFISLAPMFGFLGTVWGMIQAFDAIAEANDISPNLVADGIKVALLTTAGGLVVAVILQIFYNYLVSKIDRIVVDMEEGSIELIDALAMMNMGRPIRGRTAPAAISTGSTSAGDDLTTTDI